MLSSYQLQAEVPKNTCDEQVEAIKNTCANEKAELESIFQEIHQNTMERAKQRYEDQIGWWKYYFKNSCR